MYVSTIDHSPIAPSAATANALEALFVFECNRDVPGVAIPRPETHLVVRFGSAPRGLDVHVFGLRQTVHRKLLHMGQRTVTARLRIGAHEAVLGVPAAALAGRIVALEDLWGGALARRLFEQLADARNTVEAAAILEVAIAERLVRAGRALTRAQLAVDAAHRIADATVTSVAADLGVSERHLRRVFRHAFGVSPKVFARLTRFRRALQAAREQGHTSWASVAAASGYYDQAHLIAEFHAVAGVTPRALLSELRRSASVG